MKSRGFIFFFSLLVSLCKVCRGQNDSLLVSRISEAANSEEKVDLLNDLCKELWFSDLGKANSYGNKALELSKQIAYKEGEATALNNLGVAAWVQGDYYRALDLYYSSINIREVIGGQLGLGNTYHNIGNIFRSTKNWKEATKWFEKALAIRHEINDELGISYSKNNLGLVAQQQGEFDLALTYLDQALAIRKKIDNPRGVATSLLSIGKVHMDLGESDLAGQRFEEALAIWKSINHIQGQGMTYLSVSQLDFINGKLGDALANSNLALALANDINAKSELIEIHEHRSKIYVALNQYEKAFNEQSLSIAYKDSVFNENKINLIEQRNYAQIALKNELLESENLLQNELLKKQERIYQATVVICILLAISLLSIYGVLRIRNKTNRKLALKNEFIASQKQLIEEANALLELKVQQRTNELQLSNERLIKFSLFNSHKVRGPLARLLGLTQLTTTAKEAELKEYIRMIDASAKELDQQITEAGTELTKHLDSQ
ncbi:MAG: tetratricopeptide repeat protein [Imperialibacter sp.]|uniref:tetratricopeptide repeat protein n=1 Tax=Imperialibacter sp. TaxID=2038411 RepID=UPI0032EB2DA0